MRNICCHTLSRDPHYTTIVHKEICHNMVSHVSSCSVVIYYAFGSTLCRMNVIRRSGRNGCEHNPSVHTRTSWRRKKLFSSNPHRAKSYKFSPHLSVWKIQLCEKKICLIIVYKETTFFVFKFIQNIIYKII